MAKVNRYEPFLEELNRTIASESFPDSLQESLTEIIPAEIPDDKNMISVYRAFQSSISKWVDPIYLAEQKRSKLIADVDNDRNINRRLRKKIHEKCQRVQFTMDNEIDPYNTFNSLVSECQKTIEQQNKLKSRMAWIFFSLFVFFTLGLGLFALKKMKDHTAKLSKQRDYSEEWQNNRSTVNHDIEKKNYKATRARLTLIKELEQKFHEHRKQELAESAHNQSKNVAKPSAGQPSTAELQGLLLTNNQNNSQHSDFRKHLRQQNFNCSEANCTLFRSSISQEPVLRYCNKRQFINNPKPYSKLPIYTQSTYWPNVKNPNIVECQRLNDVMKGVVEIASDLEEQDGKKLYLQLTEDKSHLKKGFYTYKYKTCQLEPIEDLSDVLNRPVQYLFHNDENYDHRIEGFLGTVNVVNQTGDEHYHFDETYLAILPQQNQQIHIDTTLTFNPWLKHAKFHNGDVIMPSFYKYEADYLVLSRYDMTNLVQHSSENLTPKIVREFCLEDKKQIPPMSIAVSPDDKVVAALFSNRSIAFWEAATGKLLNYYRPRLQGCNKSNYEDDYFWSSISFDQDGNLRISECKDTRYTAQILPYGEKNIVPDRSQANSPTKQI